MKFQRYKQKENNQQQRSIKCIRVIDSRSNNQRIERNSQINQNDSGEYEIIQIAETSRRNSQTPTKSQQQGDGATTRRKSTLRELYASLQKYKQQKENKQNKQNKPLNQISYKNSGKKFHMLQQTKIHQQKQQNRQQRRSISPIITKNKFNINNINDGSSNFTHDRARNQSIKNNKPSISKGISIQQIQGTHKTKQQMDKGKQERLNDKFQKQEMQYIIQMLIKLVAKEQKQLQQLKQLSNIQIELERAQSTNIKLKEQLLEMKELMKSLLLQRQQQRMFSFYQDQ